MQQLLVYQKSITQQEQEHQQFYQLEEVALKLVRTSHNTSCMAHSDSANGTIQRLLHNKGCLFKNYRYYIEELGTFPCLIVSIDGKKRATNHRRISIIQLIDGIPHSLLQLRFIATSSETKCSTIGHSVKTGLSSWRYFGSLDDMFL